MAPPAEPSPIKKKVDGGATNSNILESKSQGEVVNGVSSFPAQMASKIGPANDASTVVSKKAQTLAAEEGTGRKKSDIVVSSDTKEVSTLSEVRQGFDENCTRQELIIVLCCRKGEAK